MNRIAFWLTVALGLSACGSDEPAPAAPLPEQKDPNEPAVGTVEEFIELAAPSEGLAFGVDPQGAPALYLGSNKGFVQRVAPDRTVTRVADVPGPLGMAVMVGGDLLVCGKATGDAGKSEHPGALWRVTPAGEATVLVGSTAEAPLDLPNMVAVGPAGEIVFSDSKGNRVYLVAPGATTATLLTDAITYPNGVAFSPDGSRVLIASYDSDQIFYLPRDASGAFGAPAFFASGVEAVDGITPLAKGGYILVQTHLGVVRYGDDGVSTSLAPQFAADIPANGAFGTGDFGLKWLYVSNLFGKKIKRVYLGEVGARLPVGS